MINGGLFTSNTDLWATPQDFYDSLNKEFNFTLDPCATHDNKKCERYYTSEDDGLSKNWGGAKQCFVTRLMAKRLANGLRSVLNQIPLWLHYCPPERIHVGSMTTYTTTRKFGSSKEG